MARKRVTGVPVLVALGMLVVAGAALAQEPMASSTDRVQVFSKVPLPPQVADELSGAIQPAEEAPAYTVMSSDSVKMFQSSWVRVVGKAKEKARGADATGIVVTDWGFDPSSTGSVKKTERVKKISFELVRF